MRAKLSSGTRGLNFVLNLQLCVFELQLYGSDECVFSHEGSLIFYIIIHVYTVKPV